MLSILYVQEEINSSLINLFTDRWFRYYRRWCLCGYYRCICPWLGRCCDYYRRCCHPGFLDCWLGRCCKASFQNSCRRIQLICVYSHSTVFDLTIQFFIATLILLIAEWAIGIAGECTLYAFPHWLPNGLQSFWEFLYNHSPSKLIPVQKAVCDLFCVGGVYLTSWQFHCCGFTSVADMNPDPTVCVSPPPCQEVLFDFSNDAIQIGCVVLFVLGALQVC